MSRACIACVCLGLVVLASPPAWAQAPAIRTDAAGDPLAAETLKLWALPEAAK
jgi:hypothetical protein